MITQQYTIPASSKMKVGNLIMPLHIAGTVAGYIAKIEDGRATITLFEPMKIDLVKFDGVSLAASLLDKVWQAEMNELMQIPRVRKVWEVAVRQTILKSN